MKYKTMSFSRTRIHALVAYLFQHAKCDNDMCATSRLLPSPQEITTTCVELHGFRGLYVLKIWKNIINGYVYYAYK